MLSLVVIVMLASLSDGKMNMQTLFGKKGLKGSGGEAGRPQFVLFDATTGKEVGFTPEVGYAGGESVKTDTEKLDARLELVNQGLKLIGAVAWFFVLRSFVRGLVVAGEKLVAGAGRDSELPEHVLAYLPPNVTLNSYEVEVAQSVVDPATIEAGVEQVGGLR
jgi:hypothetical protein